MRKVASEAEAWRSLYQRAWSLRRLGALIVACTWLATPAWAQSPAEVGQWAPLMQWPISATHTHLLPTGKLFFFGEFDEGLLPPRLWDPDTSTLTELPAPSYNIFCAGHSFLPDGRLLITGGHVESHVGEPHATIFNPYTSLWEAVPDMNDNRWYPTNTTLANGDVMVLSGETIGSGTCNALPQRWVSATGTWKDLNTAIKDIPYYPRMFLAPNGKLLFVGPFRTNLYLDPEGTGTWFEAARSQFGGRDYGGAVLFDNKVLITGGGDPPTNTAELLDLNAATPAWRYVSPMSVARRQHNTALLPDGTVIVAGGSSAPGFNNAAGAVMPAEVWNPGTNTWKVLASSAAFRGYHSSLVLLPDGRLVSAGGRNVQTAQVFSPPYLFKGPRPAVTSSPSLLAPGTNFFVGTPDGASIQKVTLISLASVTHSFDQNLRLLTLGFTQTAGGLTVTGPATNIAAPPGPYMVFLVNSQGVPSIGKMVRVTAVPSKASRVINFSDVWKYDDRNVDRGTAWLAAGYDDSAWQSGPGQLGFGEGDEGTELNRTFPSQPSVYFRKKITLDAPVTAARLELLHDDGVQVWINGVPVFSKYMDKGLAFSAFASVSTDNEYSRATVPLTPNPFRVGENIITAMVKQVSGSSEDLTFALSLEVEKQEGPIPDSITVLAPNGGEVFIPGKGTSINWTSGGSVSMVDLAYSTDGGASWVPVASNVVASTGTYSWTLPNVSTARALVRVSKTGGGSSDTSDAVFTISPEVSMRPIAFGAVWKYQDNGLDPGPAWISAGFNDAGWKSGAGQLGYGDGDETTVLTRTSPSQSSVYFRKKFTLSGPVTSATLRVLFDDGVLIYVNGRQVLSRNIGHIEHDRYATDGTENELVATDLSLAPSPFVVGENTIAVMVKQVGGGSPDLSFDLSLDLGVIASPP